MATLMKTKDTPSGSVDDDPEVQAAQRARGEAQQALEAADTTCRRLAPEMGRTTFTLALLTADAEVARLTGVVTEAARREEAATRDARARVIAAQRAARVVRLRRLVETAEAAHAAAVELRAWDVATAVAVGLAEEQAEAHPLPTLLGLGDAIARLTEELAGTPRRPPAPAPPRHDMRLRLTARVYDRVYGARDPGDVVDFAPEVAKDLIKRKLAVPA